MDSCLTNPPTPEDGAVDETVVGDDEMLDILDNDLDDLATDGSDVPAT